MSFLCTRHVLLTCLRACFGGVRLTASCVVDLLTPWHQGWRSPLGLHCALDCVPSCARSLKATGCCQTYSLLWGWEHYIRYDFMGAPVWDFAHLAFAQNTWCAFLGLLKGCGLSVVSLCQSLWELKLGLRWVQHILFVAACILVSDLPRFHVGTVCGSSNGGGRRFKCNSARVLWHVCLHIYPCCCAHNFSLTLCARGWAFLQTKPGHRARLYGNFEWLSSFAPCIAWRIRVRLTELPVRQGLSMSGAVVVCAACCAY